MRKTLVLDANLLVLLSVGLADEKFIARHKRLHPVYRKEHLDRLVDIIRRSPFVATTTYALTEASNLVRQCAEPMRSEVMLTLRRLIESYAELSLSSAQAAKAPEFLRLGLTDAAFFLLDSECYRVLSADLDLVLALQRRGFEVTNFQTLIFE